MVNEMEADAYRQSKIDKPDWDAQEPSIASMPKVEIPEDLKCPVCKDLLRDAVMTPVCACAICDECARNALTETDNDGNACPACGEKDNSPDELIPWRKIRWGQKNNKPFLKK